ncbi:matrixin family metalloprotease [Acinetobacter halotolerans]|uniref:Matrixin family metalloprotease n=1 Tax=Acinetobacter halotolerans TaxID=1752076 RepID=A0A4Q6X7T2_9GAMM|nr:matrixin family metalloprotease [Acinetobacter halotolerans]RZF49601.1 matrixin family metalloprotease [Acinetobacter halotolerans]
MRDQRLMIIMATCIYMSVSPVSYAQNNSHNASSHIHQSVETPLYYRIAEIDPRFNLTTQQVLELTQQAANIWTQETGKQHFIYDPHAKFSIHLVYDERQQQSSHRIQGLNQITQQQKQWENQNQQLQQAKDEIEKTTLLLANKQTQLTAQFQQYNADVQQFNQQRSSSKSLANQLTQRQKVLQQQAVTLQHDMQLHNQKTQQLNQEIKTLNQKNQQLVAAANQFNQVFQPRLFHKGHFNGKQIVIYEFTTSDDLRLTLAHEFGHALGLAHTDDPKSLMYPVIQQQNLQRFALTDSDRNLVKAIH